jgi:hypothetical protein
MSESTESPNSITPDDALPPVEPPSAGFIVQLFVVPAVIVSIIIVVWLCFNWLAHMGENPLALAEGLKRDTVDRWQKASTLADLLRAERNEAFRNDPELVQKLSDILREEIEKPTGGGKEGQVELQVFLCRAIGACELPMGLDVLMEAARSRNPGDEHELEVRRAAIEAIALLSSNLDKQELAQYPTLVPMLIGLVDNSEQTLNGPAAYALGVIGEEAGLEKLRQIVTGNYTSETRYDAAVGLARCGDPAAIETLVEMLSVDEIPNIEIPIDPEKEQPSEEELQRQRMIMVAFIRSNALKATYKLVDANSEVETSQLRAAVRELVDRGDDPKVRSLARNVLAEIDAAQE